MFAGSRISVVAAFFSIAVTHNLIGAPAEQERMPRLTSFSGPSSGNEILNVVFAKYSGKPGGHIGTIRSAWKTRLRDDDDHAAPLLIVHLVGYSMF